MKEFGEFDSALVLGSGSGRLERIITANGTAKRCKGVDISADAIKVAKKEAARDGLAQSIEYEEANLNNIKLEKGSFDAIFGWHSIHHVERLEELFGEVRRALKPEGLFIINEYVGPSRYQFTDKQVELMNWVLSNLTDNYKTSVVDGRIRKSTYREKPAVIEKDDPSESIRSGEITRLLKENFKVVYERKYGGTLLQFAMDCIVGNFDPSNEKDSLILKLLYNTEQLLIKEKVIDSDFVFMILKNK